MFASTEYLGKPLEKYWSLEPKVKIVRALVRGGLTKARLLGYYASQSPVLVFLDAHVECFPGKSTHWYTVDTHRQRRIIMLTRDLEFGIQIGSDWSQM